MWRFSTPGWTARGATALAAAAITLTLVATPAAADVAPSIVKHINPTGRSHVRYLVDMAGTLLFTADDGVHGVELWRSDGTSAGTRMVRNIRAGAAASSPRDLTAVGSRLYFTADDGQHGRELWTSDGTHDGTRLVRDITPGGKSSRISHLTRVGSRVYFGRVGKAQGPWDERWNDDLWRTDGTRAGTRLVRHFTEGQLAETAGVGGTLYFAFEAWVSRLWRSHGATTALLRGTAIHGATPYDLTAVGSTLYLGLDDDYTEPSLARTDTSTNTVTRLTGPVRPAVLTRFGHRLAFVAQPEDGRLWVSDGTVVGTTPIADIGPYDLESPEDYVDMAQVGAALFVGVATEGSSVLLRTDGTSGGTTTVWEGSADSLTDVAGVLCFRGDVDDGTWGIFRSDGTDAGTRPVATFHSSWPEMTAVGDRLFFTVRDSIHGLTLWSYVP
jgi:ELWxxDGT repeat protein